MLLNKET